MKISVVFPCVNDQQEAIETVHSVRKTAGDSVSVYVVDDCSANDLVIPAELKANVHRNFFRMGSGASRHVGAQIADGDWILMLDSHCRLEMGWLSAALEGIAAHPDAIFTGVCKGFTPKIKPFGTPAGIYYGGDLQFIGKNPNAAGIQVLESIWAKERDDMAEIPSVLGANYLCNRQWFIDNVGMNHLRVWGCEEQLLSLKAWLSGGEVRLLKNMVTWHRFRDGEKLPFHNSLFTLIYNKLFIIETMFPRDIADRMIAALPQCHDTNLATEKIRDDWRLVEAERARNKNLFTRELDWLLKKFGIPLL